MQLTRHADFSLRVLIYLSLNKSEKLVTINEISEHFDILKNHLTKVVHRLAQKGYIETIRGKNGGLRLAKNPSDIMIGDIVKAMETNMDVVDCSKPLCPLVNHCELKSILNEAKLSFISTLNKYSLADLNKKPDMMKNLLHFPN